jgi:Holliday junction resolvasome RuvABC ATP-dependent DNA helicase subunit
MIINNNIWVEKWRPTKLEDYVWIDDDQKREVEGRVRDGETLHLLLGGGPGCGKTTLAHLVFREMDVDSSDIKYVNASLMAGVEKMRIIEQIILIHARNFIPVVYDFDVAP